MCNNNDYNEFDNDNADNDNNIDDHYHNSWRQ